MNPTNFSSPSMSAMSKAQLGFEIHHGHGHFPFFWNSSCGSVKLLEQSICRHVWLSDANLLHVLLLSTEGLDWWFGRGCHPWHMSWKFSHQLLCKISSTAQLQARLNQQDHQWADSQWCHTSWDLVTFQKQRLAFHGVSWHCCHHLWPSPCCQEHFLSWEQQHPWASLPGCSHFPHHKECGCKDEEQKFWWIFLWDFIRMKRCPWRSRSGKQTFVIDH